MDRSLESSASRRSICSSGSSSSSSYVTAAYSATMDSPFATTRTNSSSRSRRSTTSHTTSSSSSSRSTSSYATAKMFVESSTPASPLDIYFDQLIRTCQKWYCNETTLATTSSDSINKTDSKNNMLHQLDITIVSDGAISHTRSLRHQAVIEARRSRRRILQPRLDNDKYTAIDQDDGHSSDDDDQWWNTDYEYGGFFGSSNNGDSNDEDVSVRTDQRCAYVPSIHIAQSVSETFSPDPSMPLTSRHPPPPPPPISSTRSFVLSKSLSESALLVSSPPSPSSSIDDRHQTHFPSPTSVMDYSTSSSECNFDSNGFAVISPVTSSRSRRQLRRWKIRKSSSYRKLDTKEQEEDQDDKLTSLTIATATSTPGSIRGSSWANGSVDVEKWVSFKQSSSQESVVFVSQSNAIFLTCKSCAGRCFLNPQPIENTLT